jgi:SH3-like domain-containing protein
VRRREINLRKEIECCGMSWADVEIKNAEGWVGQAEK